MLAELGRLLTRLTKMQSDIDSQKGSLRDHEHKFAAQRLVKDASDMATHLEARLETATQAAEPILSEKSAPVAPKLFLVRVVEALKEHASKESKTFQQIFKQICAKDNLTETEFVTYLQNLPELKGEEVIDFSEEDLKQCFLLMCADGSDEVTESKFLAQFRTTYVCTTSVAMTDVAAVKGAKTTAKLQIDDIVEALDVPIRDTDLGILRVKAKAQMGAVEGFVTISNNQGTVYLEPRSEQDESKVLIEKTLDELQEEIAKALTFMDQKSQELSKVRGGPLSTSKGELMKLRPRVNKVQVAHNSLKRRVTDAQRQHDQAMEAEKRRQREAVERKAVAAIIAKANEQVDTLQAEVDKVVPAAEAFLNGNGAELESSANAMEGVEGDLNSAIEKMEMAIDKLKVDIEGLRTSKGPSTEARNAQNKLKVRVGSLGAKCKTLLTALRALRQQMESDAYTAVAGVLRAHVQKENIEAAALFKILGKGKDVTAESLRAYIQKIPGSDLRPAQLELALSRYKARGLSKLSLMAVLQEYWKCVKEIAITTAFDVKESKTIRKIELREIVEITEAGKVDESVGLQRVRCRALVDLKEGWLSLKGNQGTSFMERTMKPYYFCEQEVQLQSGFNCNSPATHKVESGKVLEILEGPRNEPAVELFRVRGKASKDGKTGWVTLKGEQGSANIEKMKLFECKASIALTDSFDISAGKPIRKLDVGETLNVIEGPKEDPSRSLVRVMVKTRKDSKEGWVTTKGNQGTAFVEETDKHYVCKQSTPLENRMPAGSGAMLRMLEVDELFDVLEGPKMQTKEGELRVRARCLGEGGEGWFTVTSANVRPWSPDYTCKQSTDLHNKVDMASAEVVRKIEQGESLEALEAPEMTADALRVHVRAEKDGAVGYVSVKGEKGAVFLQPILGM